jgi:hypothetical protein
MIHENHGLYVQRARMHHPKGGMCAVCKNALRDCSNLHFDSMKRIETYPLETGKVVNIVRCDSFTR